MEGRDPGPLGGFRGTLFSDVMIFQGIDVICEPAVLRLCLGSSMDISAIKSDDTTE